MIGWAGHGICHGRINGSGMSCISISTPLNSCTMRKTEFTDWRRPVSSASWARKTAFSESILRNWSIIMFTCIEMRAFSSLRCATWLTSSSRCCCFLWRDRLADSRFEIILFLFLSSITSSSELEVERLLWFEVEAIWICQSGLVWVYFHRWSVEFSLRSSEIWGFYKGRREKKKGKTGNRSYSWLARRNRLFMKSHKTSKGIQQRRNEGNRNG